VTPAAFLARIDRSGGLDDCWPFRGATSADGYGRVRFAGRVQTASRVAYLLLVGPIPDGLNVLHHCDNPPCCNPGPKHLFTGTQFVNMADAAAKGRIVQQRHPERAARGERVGTARLTAAAVVGIRALREAGVTQREVAERFGMGRSTISFIERRLTWAHE
jgi:hypothetical protein